MKKQPTILLRDLSWLSFNERVMQEAKDETNHPYDRLKFLGIFSNNQDEFFRVRIATLNRIANLRKNYKRYLEEKPAHVLKAIHDEVIVQQLDFDHTCSKVIRDLQLKKIFIRNEKQLNRIQSAFVKQYFEEKVRTQIVPLMIEDIRQMPLLHDKSIYLACVLAKKGHTEMKTFSIIEVPTKNLSRFIPLPSGAHQKEIILLEDVIRHNLPEIFSAFDFDQHRGYIIKVTRDAELDLDSDVNVNILDALEKGIKNRKKGKTTRFVYDRTIDPDLLDFLIKKLLLTKSDNLIAGGRIHNFKDFMNFPSSVFNDWKPRRPAFVHPGLRQPCRIMHVLDHKDIMLHFPYHSFDSIIDLLREAAIDPFVESIKITCYRLSKDSKIVNALINAARNGKKVTAVIELRARFDEEANLEWKRLLEEEGATVSLGLPEMKVHAKLCLIKKRIGNKTSQYGILSTGNFNENTARYYGDHCLLTSRRKIISDINHIFRFLESPEEKMPALHRCRTFLVSPHNHRACFIDFMDTEIKNARTGNDAEIKIKLNNLVDQALIQKLYEAAAAGVKVSLIIRGICCAVTDHPTFKTPIQAISIIDEYLEHARVLIFHNRGKPRVFISSADWMIRNMDHRVEISCPVFNEKLKRELISMFNIQLADNVKGRILGNDRENNYVRRKNNESEVRSQLAIRQFLEKGKSIS